MKALIVYRYLIDKARQNKFIRTAKRWIMNEKFYKKSYSQCGEDLVIDHLLFGYFKLERFSYLDIGSSHPIRINNTYLFYKKGFRGVCVDANPVLIELYGNERPEDIFINSGVTSEYNNEQDFYIMNSPFIHTFDSKVAKGMVAKHGFQIDKVIKMRTMNINHIIKDYCKSPPELISIDIEGLDFDVLKSINYDKYRPKIIIVEMCGYGKIKDNQSSKMANFMQRKNYIWWGNVGFSSIFIDDIS